MASIPDTENNLVQTAVVHVITFEVQFPDPDQVGGIVFDQQDAEVMVGLCDFTIAQIDSEWTPETSTIYLARELTPTISISVE